MGRLEELVGVETDLARVGGIVRDFARTLAAPVVGAYHVTCSDESERECAEAFQHSFSERALPALKRGCRAAFRSANLGARYEIGAIHVAEQHFATVESQASFKLMVLKINAHVAARKEPGGTQYGWLYRYSSQSACCGALAALVAGANLPAVRELAELFASDGKDRLAMLKNPDVVPEEHRALVAALTNARLQARVAVRDIQAHPPTSPTEFLVLPCVTLNRPGPDTELVVGRSEVDWTGRDPTARYDGLGDDPAAYRINHQRGRLVVTDRQWLGG